MAELKAAELTPHPDPDARLIAHCERYERVADNLRTQFQEITETGFLKLNLRRDFNEAISLATSITDATPVTAAGRFAKAQAALTSLAGREGIHFQMAAAALQECMANDMESRPFRQRRSRKFEKSVRRTSSP